MSPDASGVYAGESAFDTPTAAGLSVWPGWAARDQPAQGQRRPAMKAAVFHGPHQPLTIENVDIDKPIGREVLVRTVATGVCHSDLHFVDGFYPFPTPAILGHEAAGIVEAVGPQVSEFKPGDHVIACLSVFCGHCDYCLTGQDPPLLDAAGARAKTRPAQALVEGPAGEPVRQPLRLRREDAGARERAREDRRLHAPRPRRADRLRRHHRRGRRAEHGAHRAGLHRRRLRRAAASASPRSRARASPARA